jgi:hypothetical protein
MELAGFFAAHAVWCVSDGDTLIPLGAQLDGAGERHMTRFVSDRLEEGVKRGHEWLQSLPPDAKDAVLIYDGYVTLGNWRTDALMVEVQSKMSAASLTMALPYRHAQDEVGFAVYKPKFMSHTGSGTPDYGALGEAFFRGVYQHEKGAKVWDAHIDESR